MLSSSRRLQTRRRQTHTLPCWCTGGPMFRSRGRIGSLATPKLCLAFVLAICAAAFALVASVGAFTNGELDGNRHPAVVLLLMEVSGKPAFRCSGTLLSPSILLSAGHCAGEPGEFSGMRVVNESDVQHDPTYPGPGGPNTVEAVSWMAHPLFTEAQFFRHDVGVVTLQSPGVVLNSSSYGRLP